MVTAHNIASMHMTADCLNSTKAFTPYGIGKDDCEHCHCLSALHKMVQIAKSAEERAEASRYYAKVLIFGNRPKEALPFALEAYHFYVEKCGKSSFDACVMHSELVFVYAMIDDEIYGPLARQSWRSLREKVSDFQSFPERDRVDAVFLLKHMGCDELLARAYRESDKTKKINFLKAALKIAISIKHGFLARICADLDVLGCVFTDRI